MADRLPATREIAELPRWAKVVFAARCARRILPLFKHHWPDAPEADYLALERGVDLVERAAAQGQADEGALWEVHSAAGNLAKFISEVRHDHSSFVAYAVTHAAMTAICATRQNTGLATDGARCAAEAVEDAGGPKAVVFGDFTTLLHMAHIHAWTDDTPIPVSTFGPLWPNGTPDGWLGADDPGEAFQNDKSASRSTTVISDIAETVDLLAAIARSGVSVNYEIAKRAYTIASKK